VIASKYLHFGGFVPVLDRGGDTLRVGQGIGDDINEWDPPSPAAAGLRRDRLYMTYAAPRGFCSVAPSAVDIFFWDPYLGLADSA
jgi:hypothetical protein